MRVALIAVIIAALPAMAPAAPTWQLILADSGRRIELDRTTIKREDNGKVTALGRVVLDKEIPDSRSGSNYKIIESLSRYDCTARNSATLKRVLRKADGEVLREEEVGASEMPVRAGTLDDKVLREVCRPGGPKAEAQEVAQKASEAAGKLREANDALLKEAAAKDKPAKAAAKTAVVVNPRPAPAAPRKSAAVRQPVHEEHAHAEIHWSYEGEAGPEHWARLDPKNKLCASGQRQSPIDIRDGIRVDLEPIRFDYRPSRFHIVDNGHTVQVIVAGNRISLTGKTYELVQFHFHRPSEEKINGKAFDMVVHLVHRAPDGQLAVVAILLERGSENPVIQSLWNYIPLERGQAVMPPEATVDLSALLPDSRTYYTYMGSLTTPPCSEGVLWLVLKQPVAVSEEQIRIFSRLHPNNARPVQPHAGRLIKEGR